jgi:hypothetical protein
LALIIFLDYKLGTIEDNPERTLAKFFAIAIWELAAATDLNMLDHENEEVRGCVSNHRGLVVRLSGCKASEQSR